MLIERSHGTREPSLPAVWDEEMTGLNVLTVTLHLLDGNVRQRRLGRTSCAAALIGKRCWDANGHAGLVLWLTRCHHLTSVLRDYLCR